MEDMDCDKYLVKVQYHLQKENNYSFLEKHTVGMAVDIVLNQTVSKVA